MNEQISESILPTIPSEYSPERKLWFEGPNYTADAIVIDPTAEQILLIQRKDTNEWALPGGFIDEEDTTPLAAAIREAEEEATISLDGEAHLVFRGIVDDPRNTKAAWIETSAYLFLAPSTTEVVGNDDAHAAKWHSLAELPKLYASHRTIVERALHHLASTHLIETLATPDTLTVIEAGHMEYTKTICTKDEQAVFVKQHDPLLFTDTERAERSHTYLEKEAATLAHLRQHNFQHIPTHSLLHNNALLMEAFPTDADWYWRAHQEHLETYITDTLAAFRILEAMPLAADSFPIEPSYESFRSEGWHSFTSETMTLLEQRLVDFAPRLSELSQQSARMLLNDLQQLQREATQSRSTPEFVFCHHDIRQSNIAWHPEKGSRLVDWSWAGIGERGSDSTSFLIDLAKSGHDISPYYKHLNSHHCLTLIGFWLAHSTWPSHKDDTVRFQQFLSAVSAYEVYAACFGARGSGV